MSPLDKEGREVQKTANHTVLAGGGCAKALLAVQNASRAHGKAIAILLAVLLAVLFASLLANGQELIKSSYSAFCF